MYLCKYIYTKYYLIERHFSYSLNMSPIVSLMIGFMIKYDRRNFVKFVPDSFSEKAMVYKINDFKPPAI